MKSLNHAPPRRSDWKHHDRPAFLADCHARHEAAKADWLAIHAAAAVPLHTRVLRGLRARLGRR